MRRALALVLMLGLSAAARAEKVSPRKNLSDPDQFKQFIEGSRQRQGLPEELPQATAQARAPEPAKPLPAYTPLERKTIDTASVPKWKPVDAEAPKAKGFSTGQLAALGGIGAAAFLAGMSLKRSAELDAPLSEPLHASVPAPHAETSPEIPVDLEPLPPQAKG